MPLSKRVSDLAQEQGGFVGSAILWATPPAVQTSREGSPQCVAVCPIRKDESPL